MCIEVERCPKEFQILKKKALNDLNITFFFFCDTLVAQANMP